MKTPVDVCGGIQLMVWLSLPKSVTSDPVVPTQCLILPEHRLIWLRYWGHLTQSATIATRQMALNAPGYDPTFRVLQDFRGTESNDLSHSEMILMAETLKARRQEIGIPLRLALLAPEDLGFGMGRMFVTLLGEGPLITASAFRDLDDAAAFLELSPEAHDLIRDTTTDESP